MGPSPEAWEAAWIVARARIGAALSARVWNTHEIEDLLQLAAERLYARYPTLLEVDAMTRVGIRTACHAVHDERRKRLPIAPLHVIERMCSCDSSNEDCVCDVAECAARLLPRLRERDRQVLSLIVHERLGPQAIARSLGLQRVQVDRCVKRIRAAWLQVAPSAS